MHDNYGYINTGTGKLHVNRSRLLSNGMKTSIFNVQHPGCDVASNNGTNVYRCSILSAAFIPNAF